MARNYVEHQPSEELITQTADALRASVEALENIANQRQAVDAPAAFQAPSEQNISSIPQKSLLEKLNEMPRDLKIKSGVATFGAFVVGISIGVIYSGQVVAEKDNCTDEDSRQIVVESGWRADARANLEKLFGKLPLIPAAAQGEQTLGGVRNMLMAERGYSFSERSFLDANKHTGIITFDDEGKIKDTIPSGTYCSSIPAPAFHGYQWVETDQTLGDVASANLTTPQNLQKLNPALMDYEFDEKLPEGIRIQVDLEPNKDYVYRTMDKSEKDINTASDGDEKIRNQLLRVNAAILGTGGSVSSGNEAWLPFSETEWMQENELSVRAIASTYSFTSMKLRTEQNSQSTANPAESDKAEKPDKHALPTKFGGKLLKAAEAEFKQWPKNQTDNWNGVENSNPYIKKYTEGKLGPEVSWCAYFVRYAMNKSGAKLGITETLDGESYYMPRVKDMWNWMVSGNNKDFYVYSRDSILEDEKTDYKPGDIIFFNYHGSEERFKASNGNHVGIISSVGGNQLTIIDGNYFKSDTVAERKIHRNDPQIMGVSRAIEAGATVSGVDIPPQPKLTPAESERVTDMLIERGPDWEHRAKAMRFLIDFGFEDYQAAAFVEGLVVEAGSVRLPADAKQYNNGPGRGIVMWEKGGRFDTITHSSYEHVNLVDFAKAQGTSWDDFNTQLKFIAHELRTTEQAAAQALHGASTVQEAARIVVEKYERAGIPHLERRTTGAEQFLAAYRSAAYNILG